MSIRCELRRIETDADVMLRRSVGPPSFHPAFSLEATYFAELWHFLKRRMPEEKGEGAARTAGPKFGRCLSKFNRAEGESTEERPKKAWPFAGWFHYLVSCCSRACKKTFNHVGRTRR